MANRHLSRSIALQALFEWDFITAHKNKVDEVVLRLINEFGEGAEKEFIVKLVRGILKKREVLDTIIAKAAKDWPLDQTPLVDRNVFKLCFFKLL